LAKKKRKVARTPDSVSYTEVHRPCQLSGNLHFGLKTCGGTSGSDTFLADTRGNRVLRIAAVLLLLLWVLGLVTGHTMGGFVHVLLVLSLVLWVINFVQGKNA
jgi:hypothetical protein